MTAIDISDLDDADVNAVLALAIRYKERRTVMFEKLTAIELAIRAAGTAFHVGIDLGPFLKDDGRNNEGDEPKPAPTLEWGRTPKPKKDYPTLPSWGFLIVYVGDAANKQLLASASARHQAAAGRAMPALFAKMNDELVAMIKDVDGAIGVLDRCMVGMPLPRKDVPCSKHGDTNCGCTS